jgi:hypothetical protein
MSLGLSARIRRLLSKPAGLPLTGGAIVLSAALAAKPSVARASPGAPPASASTCTEPSSELALYAAVRRQYLIEDPMFRDDGFLRPVSEEKVQELAALAGRCVDPHEAYFFDSLLRSQKKLLRQNNAYFIRWKLFPTKNDRPPKEERERHRRAVQLLGGVTIGAGR